MPGARKGADALKACKRPPEDVRVFLLTGPDDGAVDDAAHMLMTSLRINGDTLEINRIGDDVLTSRTLLAETLLQTPLLGDRPVVTARLANESASASILAGLSAAIEATSDINPIVLRAGKLRKTSKLKSTVEGLSSGLVLEIAAETEADIAERTRKAIAASGSTIEDTALSQFVADLPGNSALANQEIEKLALFAINLGRPVSVDDVRTLGSAEASSAVYHLIDQVFRGDVGSVVETYDRLLVSGTQPFSILRSLNLEYARILTAHGLKAGGDSGPSSGMKLTPPVMRWAWADFERKLDVWSADHATRALAALRETEETIKSAGQLAASLTSDLILKFTRFSASRIRR